MRFNTLFSSERGLLGTMALVFLPWLAVVLFTAGAWAALTFLGYAILVTAAGYGIASLALPAPLRTEAIALAPALGILTISALTAFWVRLGLPLIWAPALWIVVVVAGIYCGWRSKALWMRGIVGYGGALVALSAVICGVFFVPSARHDAVLRHDGSFNWIYVDTQYFYSMAAAIKDDQGAPRDPGTVTEPLHYHFAPYAPAAAISRLTGLALGDAFARVTRGAALWALLWSCFGLGTILSLKATGARFGGIMSIAGLFFYGSLLSLFANETNSSSHVAGAILVKIPGVEVLADGGPFSHLILGHSVLHGLGAITAIIGLSLISREDQAPIWRSLILLALPALAVAVNSLAALYCVGAAGILLFWGRLGKVRSWVEAMLMFCFLLGAWKIMGYSEGPDVAQVTLNQHPDKFWWTLAVWFTIGLGFRLLSFRWISRPFTDPMAVLVLATVVGLLSFSVFLEFEFGEQRYGIYFLQAMLSVFAFARLRPGAWRGKERAQWVAEWLRLACYVLIILLASVFLLRAGVYLIHSQDSIASFRRQILPFILLLALLFAISRRMKRSFRSAAVASAAVSAVLLCGFLAWIAPWINFGLGRMRMDVSLTTGEVHGLERLSALAGRDERFATNRHTLDAFVAIRGRSYGYAAVSERSPLLEGYSYRGESERAGFPALLYDNDQLFSSSDPETVHRIARKWQVRWLVARSGTDIALSHPLPAWLVPEANCGDLKIYKVD